MRIRFLASVLIFGLISPCLSQEVRFLQIGSLQSWFRADGCEPVMGRTLYSSEMIDGLQWPALYDNQDCQAAKGLWIGVKNYRDPAESGGKNYKLKVIQCGPNMPNTVDFVPIDFTLTGRFPFPQISVDGRLDERLNYNRKLDMIDPRLSCDQMINNRVNTSVGITIDRKIMAWTNPGHENYFIYDYTFTNSGNTDADPGIEQQQTLEGVYFYYTFKYAMTKEAVLGFYSAWLPFSSEWGMSMMLDTRGENPAAGDEFRAVYSWLGKHSKWDGPGDNIGAPAYLSDGHLGAAQYAGVVTLHADRSAEDHANDPWQPRTTTYIDSDDNILSAYNISDSTQMAAQYAAMTAGHAAIRHADAVGDGFADLFKQQVGGYLHAVGYGPYTLKPGQSIQIIMAEAVSGLSREQCYIIGERWLQERKPYILPNNSQTQDRNEYKNKWVYTGRDSLFQTFRQARGNYRSGFTIPLPPPPPNKFIITSAWDRISLEWSDESEADPLFAGYQVYRYINQMQLKNSEKIFECGKGTAHQQIVHKFDDVTAMRGLSYNYYILALNDGSNNSGIPLPSSLFYTLSVEPAYLRAISRIQADLYVAPQGDDQNSGLSAAMPLKTMGAALAKIGANFADPHIIHLAPGLYSPSTTGEKFPLDGQHYITIRGEDKAATILCPEDSAWAFKMSYGIQGFKLENMTIQQGRRSDGGAISCTEASDLALRNVVITRNAGFGLFFIGIDNHLSLTDVSVRNNSFSGIMIYSAKLVTLNNTAITNNQGAGLGLGSCQNVEFDSVARCNIYNNVQDISRNLGTKTDRRIKVFVDTFTVAHPSPYHVRPPDGFIFSILHPLQAQTAADLFVSVNGDDANPGTTPGQPLRTIKCAIRQIIADSSIRRTIHLADGRYSVSSTGETFPVYCPSWITVSGSAAEKCVIDGEGRSHMGMSLYGTHDAGLQNLTITGFAYNPLYIAFCDKLDLFRLAIVDNSSLESGSSMNCIYSDRILVVNATIAGNNFGRRDFNAGIFSFNSSMNILNSIIWANSPRQLCSSGLSAISVAYSDIDTTNIKEPWSFWSGLEFSVGFDGNQAADPGFADPANANYHLRPESACIDAGTAFFLAGADTLVSLSKNDYKGAAPDIGAFESDLTPVVLNDASEPLVFALSQNYPNPFNANTEICYEVPFRQAIKIELYNVLGQRAALLVDAVQPAGRYKIVINADGLASGLYIYKMQAGKQNLVRKMAVLR